MEQRKENPPKPGKAVMVLDLPESGKLVLRECPSREFVFFEIFRKTGENWNPETGIPDLAAHMTAAEMAHTMEAAKLATVKRMLTASSTTLAEAAEPVDSAASRNDNNMIVFNRSEGRKLVIRRPSRDPDEPDSVDCAMVEIFDEDMGDDFNPELEIGHGGYMTAHVLTEAIRKVVDAPNGYIL